MLFVLFGLPGSGKTYTGTLFQKEFGFFLHDGDNDLPIDMKQALSANALVTDLMRERFFQNIQQRIKTLLTNHTDIVITQTFIKENYRTDFLTTFPHAVFILIQTPQHLREKRLSKRKEYPLDSAYAKRMVANFDEPTIPHMVLYNDTEGDMHLKEQIRMLLQRR